MDFINLAAIGTVGFEMHLLLSSKVDAWGEKIKFVLLHLSVQKSAGFRSEMICLSFRKLADAAVASASRKNGGRRRASSPA